MTTHPPFGETRVTPAPAPPGDPNSEKNWLPYKDGMQINCITGKLRTTPK